MNDSNQAALPDTEGWLKTAEVLLLEYGSAVAQMENSHGINNDVASRRENDAKETMLAHLRKRPEQDDAALLNPILEALTDRQMAVTLFALRRFAMAAHEQANEAAQDVKGQRYKAGATEAFLRDAEDAESAIALVRERLDQQTTKEQS